MSRYVDGDGGRRRGGYDQRCGREARQLEQQKICGCWLKRRMKTAAETHDDECGGGTDAGGQSRGHIGRKHVDGVLLNKTATEAPMAPTPSLAEERPTKKHPACHIRRGIAEATTVF